MSYPLRHGGEKSLPSMNQNLTEIAFVLDRSGSMQSIAQSAIDGFNTFLRDQLQGSGQARLTLALFDDQYEVLAASLPVSEIVPLTHEMFAPRGCTALLDAIGKTIDDLGSRLAHMPEHSRPGKVIVAILTDGCENSSTCFTWHDVAKRIIHQREVYQWEFLFLGAGQDAIATASKLKIERRHAATFAGDSVSVDASTSVISRKARAIRATAAGIATPDELLDAAADLGTLLEEEDSKRRHP